MAITSVLRYFLVFGDALLSVSPAKHNSKDSNESRCILTVFVIRPVEQCYTAFRTSTSNDFCVLVLVTSKTPQCVYYTPVKAHFSECGGGA